MINIGVAIRICTTYDNINRNPKKIRLSKPKNSQILDLRAHSPNYANIVV